MYVRKNIARLYGLIMRALSLLTAQYNSHSLIKRVVFFRSPSYIVGGSPTSFPCWACGIGTGGGPHPPPGGPPGGTPPPPGYPPPPGNPPPSGNLPLHGKPPPGALLAGLSSCGRRMGGNSGSLSGPSLGGSGLSGSWALLRAASSFRTSAIFSILCPVCGLISFVTSLLMKVGSSVRTGSVIVAMVGLMWIDSAKLASPSSSVVFPSTPDSIVLSDHSLPSSSSSVDGAGVLGARGGCPSIGPTCPAVCTLSSKMSQR